MKRSLLRQRRSVAGRPAPARRPQPLGVSLARFTSVAAMCGALVAGVGSAKAATYSWTPTAAGAFSWGGANWSSAGFPNAIGDIANLNNNITGNQFISLNQTITLGSIVIGDPDGTNGFTLQAGTNAIGAAGYLNLDVLTGSASILKAAGADANDAIATGLQFNDNLTVTNNSTVGSLALAGPLRSLTSDISFNGAGFINTGAISTAGSLVKNDAGLTLLSVASTYGGATTINGGTLRMGLAGALPTRSALTVATGATYDLNGFAATIGSLSGGGTIANTSATAVTLTVGRDDTNSNFTGTIAPTTAANIALTKIGKGVLTWASSAASTYTGATTLNGGGLVLDFANTSLTSLLAATPVTLAGGDFTLKGKAGLAVSQTLGAFTLGATGGTITMVAGDLAGTSLTTGTVTATTSGGALLVNAPVNTSVKLGLALSALNNRFVFTDGTAGAYDWATNTGASTTTTGFSGYTTLPNTGGATTDNTIVTATQTQTNTTTTGLLKLASSLGAAQTLDLNGFDLFINSGGLLIAGTDTWNTSTGGNLKIAAAGGDLVIHQYNATTNISAGIANNTAALNLVKAGPGALTISGSNSFTGTVFVNGGTLSFSNVGVSGNGTLGQGVATAVTLRDGTTLQYTGATGTIAAATTANSHTFTLQGGNASIEVTDPAASLTLAGVISGAGGLTKLGAGTLITSVATTYTGPTIVSAGTFKAGIGTSAFGVAVPVTLLNSAVLDITGFSNTIGSLSSPSAATQVLSSGAAATLTVGGDNTSTTYAGTFTGGAVANILTKTGVGVLTLSGSTSSWTGATNINGGALRLGANNALNALTALTIGNAAGVTQFDMGGFNQTLASAQFYSTSSTGASQASLSVGTGTLTIGGTGAITYTVSTNINPQASSITGGTGGNITIAGVHAFAIGDSLSVPASQPELTVAVPINQSASAGITKTGLGHLLLSGASTYAGVTTVSGGTLTLDMNAGGSLNSASALTMGGVANTATFNLRGSSSGTSAQTLGALTTVANTYNVIALDPNNGGGTTLTLGNAWTLGAGSTLLLDYSSANTGTRQVITAGATTTTVLDASGIYPLVMVKDSAGVVGFGTRAAGANQPITRYDDTTGTTLTTSSNTAGVNFTTLGSTYTAGTLTWTNGGTLTARSVNTLTLDTTTSGGIIDMGAATNILTLTGNSILFKGGNALTLTGGQVGASGATVIVNQTSTTAALTISSLISGGAGLLIKNGDGTLIVNNSNTYTGLTNINGGTLKLGQTGGATNTPLGTNAAGTVVNMGGALDLGGFTLGTAEPLTLLGTGVSGTGALTNTGAAASYSGAVTISASGTAIGGTGDINLTAALATTVFQFNKVGPNTLTLGVTSARTGAISIDAGVLKLTAATAAGTTATVITLNGGTLNLTTDAAVIGAYPLVLAQDSTIVNTTAAATVGTSQTLGAITLGSNTLNINSGSLPATGTQTLVLGAVTLIGNPTLNIVNSTGNATTLVTPGALNDGGVVGRVITKSGNGTLTLAIAATSLVDGTRVNITGGILNSNVLAALGSLAAVDVSSGATFNVGATQQIGSLSNNGSVAIGAGLTLTIGNTVNNLGSTFGGILSGATGNVAKAGAGTLILTNSNTYGGTTAVNAGTLQLNVANALPTTTTLTLGNANNAATLNLNGNNQTLTGLTFVSPAAATVEQGIVNTGGATLTIGASGVTFTATGNTTLTQQINGGTLDLGGASRTFTIGDSTATASDVSISSLMQNGTVAKAGAGTLVLSNNSNSYAGGTSVTAGLVSVSADSALGNVSGALTLNGGGLQITGTSFNTYNNTRPLTLGTGGATFDIATAANTYTINQSLTAGGAFTKAGAGTLNLPAATTMTLAGNLAVANGTLNLAGTVNGSATASVLAYGGSPTTTVVNFTGNFTGFGTTGSSVANSVAVYNQTAGTVTATPGVANAGQYVSGAAGYGYFNLIGTGIYKASTNGQRFNVTAGSSTGVAFMGGNSQLIFQTGEYMLISYNGNGALGQFTIADAASLDRSGSARSIQLYWTGNNMYGVLNVAGGTINNTLQGINFGGSGANNDSVGIVNVDAGTVTGGLGFTNNTIVGSTNNKGFINFAGGTYRASANLTLVAADGIGNTLTTTAFGPINNSAVAGAPSFAGGMVIDPNGFTVTSNRVIADATGFFGVTQASFASTLTGATGNAGYVGAPAVQFSAPAAGGVPASGYALISGGAVTGIVITNPGTYAAGETPTLTLTGGGGTIAPFPVSALNTANLAGGITVNGTGTLALGSSVNTFTGTTTIMGGGTVTTAVLAAAGVASPLGAGVVPIILGDATTAGTLSSSGFTQTLSRGLTVNAGGGTLTNSNASTLTLDTTGITVASGGALTLSATAAAGAITQTTSALISGAGGLRINLTGAGALVTLAATNPYTGPTTLAAGTFTVNTLANGGTVSQIGASTNAAANLVFNGGTFQYTGAAVTTNRLFSIGGSFALDSSGTGALVFNSGTPSDVYATPGTASARTMTLQGANNGTLANVIQDSGTGANITSVTKTGTGTWTLAGANTHSGSTTLTTGNLLLTSLSAVQNSPLKLNGGVLQLRSDTAGTFASGGTTIGGSMTIDVDQATTGNTNRLLTLGGTASIGAFTLGITGNTSATGYTLGLGATTLTGAAVLNPTTADVAVASVTGAFNLTLGGTSTGNSIGAITTGVGTLTKNTASTWTLTGTSNYTGATNMTGGVINLGATNGISPGSAVTMANANALSTINLAGFNQTFASLTIDSASGGVNTQAIINTGGGTLTLAGDVTYGAAGSPTVASQINGGTLNLGGGARTFTVTHSASLANELVISSAIQNGTIIKAGSGSLLLTGAITAPASPTTLFSLATVTAGSLIVTGPVTSTTAQTWNNVASSNTLSGLIDLAGKLDMGANALTVTGIGQTQLANTAAGAGANGITGINVNGGVIGGLSVASGAATGLVASTGAPALTGSSSFASAAIALSGSNPLVRFAPALGTSLAGGTTQGLLAKTYSGVASLAATNFMAPGVPLASFTGTFAYLQNLPANGGLIANLPLNSPSAQFPATTSVQVTGLLNIATAGVYYFNTVTDDSSNLIIDGNAINSTANTAGILASMYLTPGLHVFNERVNNNASNGNVSVRYQGPDTANALIDIPATAFFQANAGADLVATFNNNVTLAATTSASIEVASNTTINGSLTMTGTGAGTTLNVLGSGNLTTVGFSGTTVMTDNLAISTQTANLLLGGVVSGTGFGITKSGFGALILGSANTFNGPTSVTAGAIRLNNVNALQSSALSLAAGTALQLRADANATFVPLSTTIAGNLTIDVDQLTTGQTNKVLSLGALTLPASTLSVTGNATATGYSLSLGTITATGAIVFNPTTASVAIASVTSAAAQNITLGGTATGNTIGAISTLTGTLTKNGSGTWTLSGTNSFTGATSVSAGTLNVNGSLASPGITVSGGTVNAAGALAATTVAVSGGTLNLSSALGNAVVAVSSGTLSLQSAGALNQNTLTVGGTGAVTSTVDNGINGTASIVVTNSAANLDGLFARSNNFSGTVQISGGTNTAITISNANGAGTGAINTASSAVTPTINLHIDGPGSNGTITLSNTGFFSNSSVNPTFDVNNNGGANTGNVIRLLGASPGVGTGTYSFTGGNGYSFYLDNLKATAGTVGTQLLNPTTANVNIGTLNTNHSSGIDIWQLDGTSQNNFISGAITQGTGTNKFQLNKTGTSAWSITGAGSADTWTGGLNIITGGVRLAGGDDRLPVSGNVVTLGSGATSGKLIIGGDALGGTGAGTQHTQTLTQNSATVLLATSGTGTGNSVIGGSAGGTSSGTPANNSVLNMNVLSGFTSTYGGLIGWDGQGSVGLQNNINLTKSGPGTLVLSADLTNWTGTMDDSANPGNTGPDIDATRPILTIAGGVLRATGVLNTFIAQTGGVFDDQTVSHGPNFFLKVTGGLVALSQLNDTFTNSGLTAVSSGVAALNVSGNNALLDFAGSDMYLGAIGVRLFTPASLAPGVGATYRLGGGAPWGALGSAAIGGSGGNLQLGANVLAGANRVVIGDNGTYAAGLFGNLSSVEFLTGQNYSGTTSILGGTLTFNNVTNFLGTNTGANSILLDGGSNNSGYNATLRWGSGVTTDLSPRIGIISGGTVDTGASNVVFATGLANTGGGTGGLNKNGAGTLTLTGASTYAGPTGVSAGVLQLNGATGSLAATSGLILAGGTFRYDTTGAGGAITQTLGALSIANGDSTILSQRTTSVNSTLTFASLNARTPGATVNITFAGTGATAPLNQVNFTTAPTASRFIDAGLFASGSDFAVVDSTGYVRPFIYGTDKDSTGLITSFSQGAGTVIGAGGTNADVNVTGALSAQTTQTIESLKISGATAISFVPGGGQILTITSGGLIKTGGSALLGSAATNGVIQAGATGTGELIVRQDTAGDLLTINSNIVAGSLTKSGAGTLTLGGTNTITGPITINTGTLSLNATVQYGATTGFILNGGTLSWNINANVPKLFTLGLNGGTIAVAAAGNQTFGSTSDLLGFVGAGARTLTLNTSIDRKETFQFSIGDNGGPTSLLISNAGDTSVTALNGSNTYTGSTTITRGVLQLASAGALPGGLGGTSLTSLNTGGGSLILAGGANRAILELTSASGGFFRSVGTGIDQVQWTGNGGFSNGSTTQTLAVNLGGAGATLVWGSTGFVPAASSLQFGQGAGNSNSGSLPIDFQNGLDLIGGTRTVQVENATAVTEAIFSGALVNSSATAAVFNKSGPGVLALAAINNAGTNGALTTSVSGGVLSLPNTTTAVPGINGDTTSRSITVLANGAVVVPGSTDPVLLLSRLNAASTGVVALDTSSSTAINLSDPALANVYLGAFSSPGGTPVYYNGAITMGANNTYKFANAALVSPSLNFSGIGVAVNVLVLNGPNMLVNNGATPRSVFLNSNTSAQGGAGDIYLTNYNTYSGGTILGEATGAVASNSFIGFGNDSGFGTGVVTSNGGRLGALNGDHTLSNNFSTAGTTLNVGLGGNFATDNLVNGGAMTYLGTLNFSTLTSGGIFSRGSANPALLMGDIITSSTVALPFVSPAGGTIEFLTTPAGAVPVKTFNASNRGVKWSSNPSGTIVIDSAGSFGAGPTVTTAAYLDFGVQVSGTLQVLPGITAPIVLNSKEGVTISANSNSTFNIPGAPVINDAAAAAVPGLVGNSSLTIQGIIAGASNASNAFLKSGQGTLTLSGKNTFTFSSGTAGVVVSGGTLALDYATSAPNDPILAGSMNLVIGSATGSGGTLALIGKAAQTNVQSFGTLILQARESAININSNGGTVNLTFTGVMTNALGGTLAVTPPALGTIAIASTNNTLVNGTLGTTAGLLADANLNPYVVVGGTDWGAKDATNNLVAATAFYTDNPNGTSLTANSQANLVSSVALGAASTTVGSLRLNANTALTLGLGANTLVTGGILMGTGTGVNDQLISGTGTLQGTQLSLAGKNLSIYQANPSAKLTISAVIANNTAATTTPATALSKAGPGLLVLSGTNTYTGITFFNAGAVSVDSVTAGGVAGPLGASTNVATNWAFNGGTLRYTGIDGTTDHGATFNAPSAIDVTQAGTTLTLTNSTIAITGLANTPGILRKIGPGALTIAGTIGANTNLSIHVAAGTLNLGKTGAGVAVQQANGAALIVDSGASARVTGTASTQIDPNSSVVIKAGGQFDLNAVSLAFDGLAGGGLVTSATGTPTLTLGSNHDAAISAYTVGASAAGVASTGLNSFSGVLGGTLALTKVGAGTQMLGGSTSTYTGLTTITSGTLKMSAANALPSGAGKGDVSVTGNTVVTGLIVPGTLDLGGYDQAINGLNSATGGIVVNTPTVQYTTAWGTPYGTAATIGTSTLTVGNGNASGAFNGVLQDGFSVLPGASTGTGVSGVLAFNKVGTGTQVLSGVNTYSGGTTISGGTVQINSASSLGAVASVAVINAGVLQATADIVTTRNFQLGSASSTVAVDAAKTYSVSGTFNDGAGSGTLNKAGLGTLVLTGSNGYTGGTSVAAGTLQVGSGGTTGTLGSGAITTSTNATLAIKRSDTVTLASAIGGTGNFAQTGSGTTILSGANDYGGTTTISSGTLQVGNGGNTGALGTGAVTNNASLNFMRSDAATVSAPIGGTGTITQNGSLLTLDGAVTGQALHVVNGQVKLGLGDTTPTSRNHSLTALSIDSGASVQVAAGGGLKLVQATSLSLAGTATLDLTGNAFILDYAGATQDITRTAAIASLLQVGFNGGLWNGLGGITSSKVSDDLAANPTTYQFLTGLGYMSGALTGGTFLGRAVDAGSVVARYTYYGDANLDGVVNGQDYSLIDSGFSAQSTPGFIYSWSNGDFNYDNKIDGADYALMDTAAAFTNGAAVVPAPPQSFASASSAEIPAAAEAPLAAAPEASFSDLPAAVPEPASFGLMMLGGALLGLRRRRAS